MNLKSLHQAQKAPNQHGFTLVELLIASTIFSVILLAAGSALVQVSRMYYKGVITSRTQSTARTTIDDIARTIQFNGGDIKRVGPIMYGNNDKVAVRAICVGNVRYTFAMNAQVYDDMPEGAYDAANNRIKHALWQDTVASENCGEGGIPILTNEYPSGDANNPRGRELLGQYMRLSEFAIDSEDDLVRVAVGAAYGDNDVLNFTTNASGQERAQNCQGAIVGAQWCAVSLLRTNVYKRVQ